MGIWCRIGDANNSSTRSVFTTGLSSHRYSSSSDASESSEGLLGPRLSPIWNPRSDAQNVLGWASAGRLGSASLRYVIGGVSAGRLGPTSLRDSSGFVYLVVGGVTNTSSVDLTSSIASSCPGFLCQRKRRPWGRPFLSTTGLNRRLHSGCAGTTRVRKVTRRRFAELYPVTTATEHSCLICPLF